MLPYSDVRITVRQHLCFCTRAFPVLFIIQAGDSDRSFCLSYSVWNLNDAFFIQSGIVIEQEDDRSDDPCCGIDHEDRLQRQIRDQKDWIYSFAIRLLTMICLGIHKKLSRESDDAIDTGRRMMLWYSICLIHKMLLTKEFMRSFQINLNCSRVCLVHRIAL